SLPPAVPEAGSPGAPLPAARRVAAPAEATLAATTGPSSVAAGAVGGAAGAAHLLTAPERVAAAGAVLAAREVRRLPDVFLPPGAGERGPNQPSMERAIRPGAVGRLLGLDPRLGLDPWLGLAGPGRLVEHGHRRHRVSHGNVDHRRRHRAGDRGDCLSGFG